MKEQLKKIKRSLFSLALPLTNTILLESAPDLSDNTKAVFDEMIRRGMNKKYKLVWLMRGKTGGPEIKNVRYMTGTSFWFRFYNYTCKCFVCCNGWLPTKRKKQKSFYLSHGTPIKSVRDYYEFPNHVDYCLAAGEGVAPIVEREFTGGRAELFALGFPRNDALTNEHRDLTPLFPEVDFNKAIVWYPTFRQHKNGEIASSSNALPIIYDAQKAAALNEFAGQNKVLIILKPHFAQDVSYIKDLGLSNIKFIDDSFFSKNNISSYGFVGSCDALITDYSSIYYDYTLCDKPIALIWEDYEEYKKSPGFAEGVEEFLSGGEKVYTLEELQGFIKNVADGRDVLKKERNEVCGLVNYAADGKNAERVVDFIIEKAGL